MDVDLKSLREAIENDAAVRRTQRLQPAGGRGDKIFPPTYPSDPRGGPPRHVFERRRMGDMEVWCVLVDSVQSQGNRLEEALREADLESGMLPYVTVDFRGAGLEPLERITSLDAPHRVYDAIFRDSLLNGAAFMETEEGRRLAAAKSVDATALLELSPTALLFGAWHSQGQGGGMGAKFPRAIVSEIVAIGVPVDEMPDGEVRTAGRQPGSRIDPLGILRGVEVYKGASGWDTDKGKAGKGAKRVRPSEINHSNVAPSVAPLGVTCDYVEHRTVITLAGLRRLRFGGGRRDAAGRNLIAALGLLALVEQDARGYALRSRCNLVCDGGATPFERVRSDGSTEPFGLDRAAAHALYRDAYVSAKEAGFRFRSLILEPQAKLVEIVRQSRELALEGRGRGSEGDA